MLDATFEQEGDRAVLKLVTHFGTEHDIVCTKNPDEIFRVGGSAINDIAIYEGLLLSTPSETDRLSSFRAYINNDTDFVDTGVLSPEDWQDESDRHCYVMEYYPLDMEGSKPQWIICKDIISQPNHIFVNVDILDGGNNQVKRYRISSFFGDYIIK
jgi:hypothetical protein